MPHQQKSLYKHTVLKVGYVTLVEDISTGATVLKIYPQVVCFMVAATYLPSRQCRLSIKDLIHFTTPSARIHVVEPSGLSELAIGREYNISFVVTGADNNVIYIPENSIFESVISEEYFKVISRSHNGSCFNVKAIKSGTTKL
uniref:NUP210 fourth Ig-like domain-containing protein n=1 Tax=Wuchereria bancrofti TaxID=6293 RepID=A0A1I8EZZ2_WUCBA